jgi:WD40 repeat protein
VRLLIEADKEPKTFEKAVALLSGANLTFDTITFVGLLLSKMATKDVDNAKRCLVAMIIKTRNQSREDVNIARLGASAINIYFATWQELPNIDDWTYLVLDNAYLPVADFSDKNLTGTSLRNAQLDNANFTNTNLTDCDLTGAKLIRECIVSASEDGTVRVWDSATGKLVRILEGHGSSVRSVCFSPDGKTIASASRDKTVRVWDSATGKLIHTIEGHTDSVTGVCFNPVDGNTIASVSSDKTLRVWDSKSGMLLRTLTGHTAPVSGVCFSPDGKTLASASRDMTVKLWDNETGEVLRTLTDHTDYVWCVCFSLDGKTLASASVDMTVRLWDCESGMLLRTLTGHTNSVYGMCFSPDGKYLASASRDRSVIIWEIENGKQIHILHGHKSSVFGICFSPNTRTLDCSKIDKPLILWFDVVRVTDVPVVGGKNAHLGEMLYTGLPVPKGFAVTSFAYERFIEETQLSTEIESIIKKTVTDHTDLKQRDAASNYIRKLIERTPMPKDIEETIRNAYEELNKRLNSTDDVFAAVISSATTEDLPDTSSVIHQETALNVKGSDDLIEKILKSWSSLFTPSAISYRGEKHLAHDEVSISVGVQQMINSRTGGIMYTLNPKTGDQNEIVIKGSFGLGEAVVSGSVNPDGFVVDKLAGDIKERCIAKKTVEYIRDLAGKTIHSNVVGDRVNEPCINDDEIMVLVDLARKIEKHYGKPMGIEWAIDKDLSFPENIFIVQTRPNILKSKQYDDLIIPFCKAIDDLNFEDAFVLLPKLESADPDRYKKLIDELAFVFNPTESLQSNKEKWIGKEPIEYKAKLWSLLTNENHRTQEDNADEMVQNTLSNDLKEAINQKDIEQITISEMEKTENPQQQKQQKGAALEVNVLKLIQKLFDNISDADGILVELRRQLSGSQGGFDIQFTYKDAMGAECTCNIECKDYVNTIITMETVSEKLLQKHTKMAESEKLHHWILISPTGKVANELYTALQKWEKNHFWRPIQKVQVWTGVKNETGEPREPCVNELFALIPEVYRHYYPGGTLNPEEWDEAKRSAVQNKWKEKLAPAILLSEAWSVYLRDPSKLLTDSENSPEIDGNPDALYKQYDALYKQHLPVRCCDEGGNLLNLSTEKYLLDWINKSANSALFLLGEFGDGKTFLTYSLARRLTEDFLKSPDKGIIPIRLTLKDLNNDNGNNFLCDRLNQFGATLNEFNTIKQKHTVLIILDGFDEMSIGMDLRTINENTRRLCKCVNLFNGLKIIITSRTPVFKKIWQQLLQRVQSSMTIYLAPIDNPEVKIAYLQEFAKEKHVQERFEKLCATHDLLGLASKPLFLEMVKTTMLNGEIKDVDNVTIYESYVEATLKRKEYTPIDLGSGLLVDLDRVLSQYKLVMEDFALMIFEKGIQTRISEKDFKHYTNEPELTTRIWKELTNPTTEDVENTENRIINRSLLKATDQGFTFCHRSMIEYFVANGICRRLIEAPNDAETFLFNTKLTFETIDFAGKILSKMSGKDSENAKQQLVSMITKTRWCSPDGDIARSGTSAINIYFAAWKELPNIDNWTYLFLDNASLPEADFSSKNLTGTSLKYANLDNVNFTNTNLTDCDLTGVKFDETNEIQTMKALQYNGYLYVLYIGGKLRKWNIHDGSHKDVSTNFDAPSNIGISIWDLMFFEKNKIHFTHKTTEEGALELRGGVQLHKDEVVLDIVENNVLVTRSNQLSFHNLATDAFVFENQPVSSLFKSVIVNDSSVLLFDNVNGLRLLIKDGNNEVHEKKLRVHDSNDRSFEDVITMAVQLIRTDVGVFRVCLGYKNHSLALYEFKLSEQQINEDTYYLKAIALHSCGQYIKNICFLSACKIVYTGIDGIIHVLTLNEFGELQEEPPWRLAIQCEGALVKGVKQEEQKVKLKEYGGIEQ